MAMGVDEANWGMNERMVEVLSRALVSNW